MSQKSIFDGKLYSEPTAKSAIKSGVKNTGSPLSSGNILILDTGAVSDDESFGGGVGINDGSSDRQISDNFVLNEFNSAKEMKDFLKGGYLYDVADYLYSPHPSINGASKVYYIRAAATTASTLAITLGTAGAGGLTFTTKEEGLCTIGNKNASNELDFGYGFSIEAGTIDTAKYVFKFWRGAYRGADANGYLYDGVSRAVAATQPILIAESNEISTVNELTADLDINAEFQKYFTYSSVTDIALIAGDLSTDYELLVGGTETFSNAHLLTALSLITDLDNTFFLCLDEGDDAATNNLDILSHIQSDAAFKKFAFIPGGGTQAKFTTDSKVDAATFDSRYGVLCHHSQKIPYVLNKEVKVPKSSLYFAAAVCGAHAGQTPQTPLTYKPIRVGTLDHVLTDAERVDALDSGVLHLKFVRSLGWVINQSINTKQQNSYLINTDGSSPEISVERIIAQMNREISEGAEPLFIGGNRFSVTANDLITYTAGYLQSNKAVIGERDGMVISFSNIKAVRTGTVWSVTYSFEANTPINKVFHTGTIIDESLFA